MNCLSITNISDLKKHNDYELVEIRLDKMITSYREGLSIVEKIPENLKNKLIFTCRSNSKILNIHQRQELYSAALKKCNFLDLDIEKDQEIYSVLKNNLCNNSLITSYHNYENTPEVESLKVVYENMKKWQPEYYKIVCLAKREIDNLIIGKIRSLDLRISAFNMGKKGRISRFENFLAGRFLNYFSSGKKASAPGQFTLKGLKKLKTTFTNENLSYFSVTGHPVSHSFSPEIFEIIANLSNYQDNYCYLRVAAGQLSDILDFQQELPLEAFNTTMPYKKELYTHYSKTLPVMIPEKLKNLGAINSVKEQKLYNSDFAGLLDWFTKSELERYQKIIILGSGDSAAAALAALLATNKEKTKIILLSRSLSKAKERFKSAKIHFGTYDSLKDLLSASEDKLLISTLPPAGIKVIANLELKLQNTDIIDTLYHNSFWQNYIPDNCSYFSGLYWLTAQAIALFKFFSERKIPAKITYEQVVKALQKKIHHKSKIISLIGYMGSGKSTIGRKLAAKLACRFVDLDEYIEKETGLSPALIIRKNGEEFFRNIESEALNKMLSSERKIILSCGGGIVEKEGNMELLKTKTLPIWLFAPFTVICQRLQKSDLDRPLFKTTPAKAYKHFKNREEKYAKLAYLTINNNKESVEEIINLIEFELNNYYD